MREQRKKREEKQRLAEMRPKVRVLSEHKLAALPLPLVPACPRSEGWIWEKLQGQWKKEGKFKFGWYLKARFWYKWHTLINYFHRAQWQALRLATVRIAHISSLIHPSPPLSSQCHSPAQLLWLLFFFFLMNMVEAFSQKNFLLCPGCSKNMPQTCQGLNTAVLWGYPAGGSSWDKEKEGEFGLNLVKGENNIWFWNKHSSFG